MSAGARLLTMFFFFSSRRRHTRSVSAFLLNRSSDLSCCQYHQLYRLSRNCSKYRQQLYQYHEKYQPHQKRSEERFSRNAETDLVCRLLLEKKKDTVKISFACTHNPELTQGQMHAEEHPPKLT